MSFQKVIAFVALMVFALQGAMAAPEHHPALALRAPQLRKPPYKPAKSRPQAHEDSEDVEIWIIYI